MKKLVALSLLLCVAAYANAAFFDDFNDGTLSPWTITQQDTASYGYMALTLESGSDYAIYKPDQDTKWAVAQADLGGAMSGIVTISATFRANDATSGRPAGLGLVDASGKGIILAAQSGGAYWGMGTYTTNNGGLDYAQGINNVVDANTTVTADHILKWDVNLATGAVTQYLDGAQQGSVVTQALPSGMGNVTSVLIVDKKKVWVDDVSVTPEPVTMALLGVGGLGMLIRRKR